MSEGELKKRIRETMKDYGLEGVYFDAVHDLMQIWDEAKQDFPNIENDEIWKKYLRAESGVAGDYPELSTFLDYLVTIVKKFAESKKKWFGEVDNECSSGNES